MAKNEIMKRSPGGYRLGSGKKRKQIDQKLLFKLAQTMLSQQSIGLILDCTPKHLQERYQHIIDKGREIRRHSLVEAMWEKALVEKDTKMMIWLSKQHLGYKENFPDQPTQVLFNVICNEVPK